MTSDSLKRKSGHGNDLTHDINSVREALVFLNQWPKGRRGPAYSSR